jgi:PAS domain S-box-containing protein
MEMDDHGIYKWANNAGFDFFGNDILGKSADSFIDKNINQDDHLDSSYARINKFVYAENLQKRKDGTIRLLAWHYHPLKDHLGNIIGSIASARDITDQKKSEEALQQSRESFRLIAEHIDEVFWIFDVDNRIMQYASPSFERVWGISRENLYTNQDVFKNSIHSDDRDRVLSILFSMNDGVPFDFEYRIIQPEGSIRQIYDRAYPIKDTHGHIGRLIGVAKDITEEKRAEDELKRSKNYLNQIINCIGDPLFVKDRQHRFLLVNDANCIMTGIPREEFIGKSMDAVFPKEFADSIHIQEKHVFETGKPLISIDELIRRDGLRHTVMSNKTLLIDESGEMQLIGVLRDVTEMKRAEKEREEIELRLRQAQKLEAIGQLAAGIAHEINTPTQYVSDNTRFIKDEFANLTKVFEAYAGLLKTVREGNSSSQLLDRVEAVVSQADLDYLLEEIPKALSQSLEGLGRISTIVRAMKEFSHPGGEEKQSIDLNHAVQNTITVCRNEWKYVADMSLDLDPALPHVPCLPGELNQVILNLIVNAAHAITDVLEAGNKGKGTISVSTRRVDDWVEIRIGDTGTGIPEKYREKIFTLFFTTKGVGKGTGQGLAISRSVIVGKHGGTIDFITELGKGTVFLIRLPLKPV